MALTGPAKPHFRKAIALQGTSARSFRRSRGQKPIPLSREVRTTLPECVACRTSKTNKLCEYSLAPWGAETPVSFHFH